MHSINYEFITFPLPLQPLRDPASPVITDRKLTVQHRNWPFFTIPYRSPPTLIVTYRYLKRVSNGNSREWEGQWPLGMVTNGDGHEGNDQ